VRIALALAAIGLVTTASADRLFRAPKGTILQPGCVRIEHASLLADSGQYTDWLQVGVTDRIELSAIHETIPGGHDRTSINVDYNFFPALSEDFPGIGFGVADVLNRTERGFSYYVAFALVAPLVNGAAWQKDFSLYFGAGGGGIKGVFVGFEFPFTNNFSLEAEHDSIGISAGAEWFLSGGVSVRMYIQQERLTWGLTFSHSFSGGY
jgi:hypothetical protein